MFSRISAGSLSSSPRQAAMRQALPLLAAQASCRIAGAALRARRPLGGESTAFRRAFGNSNPLSTEFLYRDQGFAVVGDTPVTDTTASMFTVSVRNGFLPREDPLVQLPEAYTALESLLQRMPLVLPDGRPGLLSLGDFGKAIDDELPLYDVSKVEDARLLSGLFRDYTFAASAYLLEPCDLRYKATRKDYGLGRDKLPKNIAIPLVTVARKIGAMPFMEYAHSYALYNYKRINCSRGLDYDNLELIRRFSGSAAEHGFILVHVAMARHSGDLLRACMDVLRGAGAKDRQAFDGALRDMRVVYQRINDVMETMWEKSDPEQYLDFRTFIMGTKNQPMFPKGVAFQGVGERGEDVVMFHRGESGANDSMIPLGDNLLQITEKMPRNPLTQTLQDFRAYRPASHRAFIDFVERRAKEVHVRAFADGEPNSAVCFLAVVDQIRAFRHRHWNFTKEYIIKHTNHPVATGGSPIVTWLPNQLDAVLKTMDEVGDNVDAWRLTKENRELFEEIKIRAKTQRRVLAREVEEIKTRFAGQDITNEEV